MKRVLLGSVVGLYSCHCLAGSYAMDADAIGYAGAATASANFISSGFYNPALAAFGNQGKRFAVSFPTLGIRNHDPDRFINDLEDFSSSSSLTSLQNLANKQAIISGHIGGAAGIATNNISGVFFLSALTEGIVQSEISPNSIALSRARVVGAGVIDIGIALAKKIDIGAIPLAVGISPKIQQIFTYQYDTPVTNFNLSSWTDKTNRTDDSTYNLDIGLAWQGEQLRAGLTAKNLFRKTLTTRQRIYRYTFELNPVYTLGAAWQSQRYILSADIDLNQQKRFSADSGPQLNDDTQLFSLGLRYNYNPSIQFKTGFIHDLQHTLDNSYTLGVGVGFTDNARVDFAAELAKQNSYGLFVQLSFNI